MQTPEQIIEIKLSPMVQGLSRAVNSFSKSAEMHAKAVEINLKRTQEIASAATQLIEEFRTAETERQQSAALTSGPWSRSGGGMAK